MATYVQRWTAICEGMLGKPATAAQMQRAGMVIGSLTVGPDVYSTMTNEQKAKVAVDYVRFHVIGLVKAFDITTAANAAGTGVEGEFSEATP